MVFSVYIVSAGGTPVRHAGPGAPENAKEPKEHLPSSDSLPNTIDYSQLSHFHSATTFDPFLLHLYSSPWHLKKLILLSIPATLAGLAEIYRTRTLGVVFRGGNLMHFVLRSRWRTRSSLGCVELLIAGMERIQVVMAGSTQISF